MFSGWVLVSNLKPRNHSEVFRQDKPLTRSANDKQKISEENQLRISRKNIFIPAERQFQA